MIDLFFQIVLNNVCISLVLAIIASIVGIAFKRPFITYLIWLLVFLKLLTPPVLKIAIIPTQWIDQPTPSVYFGIDKQPVMHSVEFSGSNGINNPPSEMVPFNQIQGKHLALILWVLGSMAVLIWSTLQIYRFHRLLKKESETGSPEIQSAAMEIGACLGLKAVPTIHTISANISPMVWWIGGKVWVVIPAAILKQLSAEQFQWILSHELAHVRRRDYMIRWIEWLVCVCFWWNPVTWWARYNLRNNEELCCDALVLSSMKPKPYTYGDSLLKVIEIITWPPQQPFVIASGINKGGLLKRRVKMIISNDLIKSKLHWLQACILLGALFVLPLGLTNARDTVNVEPAVSNESHIIQPQDIDKNRADIDESSHNSQLQEIDNQIADLKARIDETNAMLKEYLSENGETTKTEQELILLNRDYDNLNALYNSLMERVLEFEKTGGKNLENKSQIELEAYSGTLDFLSDEQKRVEIQLKQKEEEITIYMEKYKGDLPEQLRTNINILLQENSNLREAKNRRSAIVREALVNDAPISQGSSSGGQTQDVTDLASLKNELADLQTRYTENHPDVILLKEVIARLEFKREQDSIKHGEAP